MAREVYSVIKGREVLLVTRGAGLSAFAFEKEKWEDLNSAHRQQPGVTKGSVLGGGSWGQSSLQQPFFPVTPQLWFLPLGLPGLPSLVRDDPVLPGGCDASGGDPWPRHPDPCKLPGGKAEDPPAATAALCE